MLEEQKEGLIDRVAAELMNEANGSFELARNAVGEGLDEIEKLLLNHSESI